MIYPQTREKLTFGQPMTDFFNSFFSSCKKTNELTVREGGNVFHDLL